jgi:iron transport multicopper oxidase
MQSLTTFLFLALSASLATCKTITYNWSIDFVNAAPDNFTRQVIGINGQWPCPTIEGTVGDQIVVHVTNNLGTQSTGLHFHGLNQFGTQVMDGPTGVTQCPIQPGGTFTYSFNLDAPGTFWYHSHNMGQYPDGLRGPLIVHDPNDPYAGQFDEEFVLTVSDWYHTPVPTLIDQMLVTTNTHFLPPFPDALLVNDSSSAQLNFQAGKTYKIKVISTAAFAAVLLQFDSHTMHLISIDGSYVQKKDAYQIRVAPAQRYEFLLTAQTSVRRNYGFLASLDMNRDYATGGSTNVWPFNITGVIQYDASKGAPPAFSVPAWTSVQDDAKLVALDNQALLGQPDVVDKDIRLNFNFGFDVNGIPRAFFNNSTYISQKVPSLFTAFTTGSSNTNPIIYGDVNPFVVNKGDVVQIVVNNLDAAIHPFHLHGHQFQVCERPESGKGSYTGHGRNFPAVPPKRDTIAVNAGSYVVLRFKAENPGVWLFHCHIEWHVIMGLSATIIEAPQELAGLTIPADHLAVCQAQGIPTAGNAAGNTANYTDLTGANTVPLFPDRGALFPKRSVPQVSAMKRDKRTSKLARRAADFAIDGYGL